MWPPGTCWLPCLLACWQAGRTRTTALAPHPPDTFDKDPISSAQGKLQVLQDCSWQYVYNVDAQSRELRQDMTQDIVCRYNSEAGSCISLNLQQQAPFHGMACPMLDVEPGAALKRIKSIPLCIPSACDQRRASQLHLCQLDQTTFAENVLNRTLMWVGFTSSTYHGFAAGVSDNPA